MRASAGDADRARDFRPRALEGGTIRPEDMT